MMVAAASGGWTLENASYDSVSYDAGTQISAGRGVVFKPDGTKMFIADSTADDVFEYDLSTAWDITSASYSSASFDISGQSTGCWSLSFRDDGTRMFVLDSDGNVYEYDLSTAWDVTSASDNASPFDVSTQDVSPRDIFFKPDGTKMFMVGATSDTVYQYSLSTAWDVSTASYDSKSFSVSSQEAAPLSIHFDTDGTKMFMIGAVGEDVHQYSLSTAWDISTASYESISFAGDGQEASPRLIAFKDDGTKMFIMGDTNDTLYQYSTE
jgi:DNA-binding beta-propeller fold protein YncE